MNGRYKRPESVLVVIYTASAEALLLRRREPADFWQSVTGSLLWDESPAAAARRELQEETGLGDSYVPSASGRTQQFAIMPAWRNRYAADVRDNLEHEFQLCLPRPESIRINPAEHIEYVWLPLAEAAARATSWTNRAAFERLLAAQSD